MEKYCKSYNELSAIKPDEYTGYLWVSNEDQYQTVNGPVDLSAYARNPFVVEGNLLSKDKKTSISIRHTGTGYIVSVFDLTEITQLPEEQLTKIEYLIHKNEGKVKFVQVWLPEKDILCADMEVLRPAFQYFDGFLIDNK